MGKQSRKELRITGGNLHLYKSLILNDKEQVASLYRGGGAEAQKKEEQVVRMEPLSSHLCCPHACISEGENKQFIHIKLLERSHPVP